MVVIDGKRILFLVLLVLCCCASAQAGSLDECLALQAIPKDDPLVIPPSDEEVQACFIRAVVDSGNVLDCLFAPSPDVCVIGFADEAKDPSAIKTYVDARFPDYQADRYEEYMDDITGQKELMVRQRNDLLMTLAGSYLACTGDFNVLDLFDSTYETYYRDQILQGSLGANVAATGYAPRLDYCDNLSGGYLDNYYIKTAWETPEMSFLSNREFCEGAVAALRSLVNDEDSCGTELPDRLRLIEGLAEEDIAQAVADCRAWKADFLAKLESLAEAFAESEGKNLEELLYRWERTQTLVNPDNAPTEFYGGGETPGFYTGERYLGKLHLFTVTDGTISFRDKDVDHGFLYHDATFTAVFDQPPSMMTADETYLLTGTTSGSGFVSESSWFGASGITFQYWSDGGIIGGDWIAYTNLDFITDTASATFTAPTGPVGEQLSINAQLRNCAACRVQWVYTLRKFELIDLLLDRTQDQPMNLAHLTGYFDVTLTLKDAVNNMQVLAGVPLAEDAPRPGDLTGDGKAGIKDAIKIFQSLSQDL